MDRKLQGVLAAALAVVVLCLGACATLPSGGSDAELRAEALFRDGDLRGAAVAFVEAANADRRERNRLLLRAAEAWRENGDTVAVGSVLEQIEPRRLRGGESLRYALLRSEVALEAGDNATVLQLLTADPGSVPRAQRARFHELRGRALLPDNPFGAAREFARLDALLEGAQRRDNARRLRETLGRVADDDLRRASMTLAAADPVRPFAARAITSRGLSLPEQLRDSPARVAPRDRRPGATPRIALLLPLSGPLRAAGVPVRDGFLAARFAAGDHPAEVSLIDSGGTPESALEAYRRAVAEGADQVVGPLTRDAVSMLFAERDLPVPVLALNRGAGPLPPGHLSFALSPEDESVVVARLLQQRGLRRVFAVAAPDELAQRTLEAFRARHLQLGGELLAAATLPPTGVDFRKQLVDALTGAGLPTEAPRDLNIAYDPGFDAVFIAVRPEQARLLIPQLKLAGMIGLPMLGTSMLHAVDDNSRQDRELDGIEFTELPWLVDERPGLPSRSALRAQLDSAQGAPARLFAFGMDAWRLLQFRDSLLDADLPIAAATGDLRIDAFGEARSQPIIARFRSGVARPVESGALLPE